MLTGEVDPISIKPEVPPETVTMLEATNILFMGTNIVEGDGKGIVIATGADNQLSRIAANAGGDDVVSSLQRDIERLVKIIGSFAIITASVVVLFWAFNLRVYHNGFMSVSSMIANSVSVAVAYIPEGLPLALSMGLTIIANRLCVVHKVLVKRLATIETLGSMSFLGSDKTGTLTKNQMTVTNLLHAGVMKLDNYQPETKGSMIMNPVDASNRVAVFCNQSTVQIENIEISKDEDLSDVESGIALKNPTSVLPSNLQSDKDIMEMIEKPSKKFKKVRMPIGSNATDRALLAWTLPTGQYDTLISKYRLLLQMPFNSSTKLAASIVEEIETGEVYVLMKGAPERIIKHCINYLDGEGYSQKITPLFQDHMLTMIDEEASLGRRMVGLAQLGPLSLLGYKKDHKYTYEPTPNFPMLGYHFIGAVAISDPPKEGVCEAIDSLREAGIIVAMITGDAANTAEAIAKEIHIISSTLANNIRVDRLIDFYARYPQDYNIEQLPAELKKLGTYSDKHSEAIIVTGSELDIIDQDAWDYVFEHKELVFARTTPEHKLMIVKEAQRRGHRVGVTGDGVNDSPALKNADVGIAMNNGADVARDAAAIVLLNDDFASIVHGVKEGRVIFENLRKVIGYQIAAGCWAELLPVLATFFLGIPQPLSSFLMIMISCISDVFAGVALMNEPAEHAIMKRPPRDLKNSPLLNYKLVLYGYLFIGNLESIGPFFNYFWYMANRGNTRAVPDPIPADDDGSRSFPAGYRLSQLIGAWNWGLADGDLYDDQMKAAAVGSSVFYVAIVVAQMGHLLSIRRKTPYFYDAIMNTQVYQAHMLAEDTNEHASVTTDGLNNNNTQEMTTTLRINQSKFYLNRPIYQRIWDEICYTRFPRNVLYAWFGSICTIIFFNYIPVFTMYCGTANVPGKYWGYAFGWSLMCFVLAEIRKWIIILYPDSWIAHLDF